MSSDFLYWLVEATLATSAATLVVLSLRRPLRHAFGPSGAYLAWLAVPATLVAVCVPAATSTAALRIVAMGALPGPMSSPAMGMADASTTVPAMAWTWAAGALATMAWLVVAQLRFLRAVGPLRRRDDGLWQSRATRGLPAVVGWRARIVLPADFEERFDAVERELVLCHERMHLRRGDLATSVLAALLRCVFWFNPLLHFAARRFADDQELACDAAVLSRYPHRRRYADALLKAHAEGPVPAFGTRAFGAHPLKERIRMLTRPLPTPMRWFAGACLSIALAGGIAAAAWAAQPAARAGDGTAPDDVMIPLDVRFAMDGSEEHALRIGERPGSPFLLEQRSDGSGWAASFSVRPVGAGTYVLKGTVDHDGEWISTREMQVQVDREALVEVEHPDGDGSFRMGVTVRDPKRPRAVPANDPNGMAASGIAGPAPSYARAAIANGESGVVMLLLTVDADGSVLRTEYKAEGSTVPADSPLAQSAMEAAKKWTMDPATENGEPVQGQVVVPVRFELKGPPGS